MPFARHGTRHLGAVRNVQHDARAIQRAWRDPAQEFEHSHKGRAELFGGSGTPFRTVHRPATLELIEDFSGRGDSVLPGEADVREFQKVLVENVEGADVRTVHQLEVLVDIARAERDARDANNTYEMHRRLYSAV